MFFYGASEIPELPVDLTKQRLAVRTEVRTTVILI